MYMHRVIDSTTRLPCFFALRHHPKTSSWYPLSTIVLRNRVKINEFNHRASVSITIVFVYHATRSFHRPRADWLRGDTPLRMTSAPVMRRVDDFNDLITVACLAAWFAPQFHWLAEYCLLGGATRWFSDPAMASAYGRRWPSSPTLSSHVW